MSSLCGRRRRASLGEQRGPDGGDGQVLCDGGQRVAVRPGSDRSNDGTDP